MRKPELLAPAGNLEKLKWAFLYGADAVYIGGKDYSLRANAVNFSIDEIKEAVNYAHKYNKKVYVTLNMVFHNEDVLNLKSYLNSLASAKVDAIIISDPLIIDIVNDNKIDLQMHLSTQASILNKDAALYYRKKNITRIVLARECTRDDIKDIIDNVDVDIECFIHGAVCTNISGRCVLSNYFTNRDANRGGCAQVCRFNFDLYDFNKKIIKDDESFTIASKDLSLFEYLEDMINIGISSFKLEGRMRSIYYISTIVSVYRKLIDMYCNNSVDNEYINKASKILNRCANREVKAQFYNRLPKEGEQYYNSRKEDSNQDFLGVVLDYKDGYVIIEQRNYFEVFQNVNIFSPDGNDYSFIITKMLDENNNIIEKARHPREIIKIKCPKKIMKNSLMRVNFLD